MSTGGNVPPSFKVPFQIPDAPERVTLPELTSLATNLLRTCFDAFQRKPGAYETALSQANWWHFWVVVGASSLVSAITSAFTLAALEVQFAAAFPGDSVNVLRPVVGLVIAIPVSFIAFYAGCYASHWWAITQAGGQAALLQHSYVLTVIWAAENILAGLVTMALTFIGLSGLGLMLTLAIALYALFVMAGHIGRLYQFKEQSRTWVTAGVMVVSSWVVGFVLQALLI
mgnify:CR=1 FL=1